MSLPAFLVCVLLITPGIALWLYFYRNARIHLQQWANERHLRILRARRCWIFMPWPLWLASGRFDQVYRITVEHTSGHSRRSGWIRLSGLHFNVIPTEPDDVVWEDKR